MNFKKLLPVLAFASALTACDEPVEYVYTPTADHDVVTGENYNGNVLGFYVLNEGNQGANTCTLDYFDYSTRTYSRNIYAERNPDKVLELGDVGNDIIVDGNRLFIVVNGSNKLEVLDAKTAKSLGKVDIASPRYVAVNGNYAYVTSFVGGEGNNGSVVRVNLSTMQTEGSVSVGLCPEGLTFAGGKLFVANSQNYSLGKFDNRIFVIDPAKMSVDYTIEAGLNLRQIKANANGTIFVQSQGNYYDVPSSLIALTAGADGKYAPKNENITPVNAFALDGKSKIYYYGVTYDANWMPTNSYGALAQATLDAVESPLSQADTKDIQSPYTIAVQPDNGDIIIADAKNYVSSGELRVFNTNGQLKWTAKTGDIPGHIAFVCK